jgi:peptide/nickel transport system substrate-binding protein
MQMKMFKYIVLTLGFLSASIFAQEKINVAISAAPSSLSPFYSTDANSQNINRLVHSSLIDFNEKMQFICIACETYRDEMQGSKEVLTFKLKRGLTFSDGSPVTTEDVKKSWQYFAKNEKIKSTFMGAFEPIEDVIVVDARTVKFIFKTFSLENLSNLGLMKIVKIKDLNKESFEPFDILGCGDYKFSKINPLEIEVIHRKGTRPTLSFKVVKDETTLALKLLHNEIDLSVANMSPRKIYWLKSQPGIKVWEKPSGNFQFMGINHKHDVFRDIRVRKAFSLLLPREEILKYKLKNTAVLSTGMFSPAFIDMYEARTVERHDEFEARKLLAEAGYKKNKKGFLEKDGKVLEIDWKVSNNKASIEIVEVLQSFFQKEGIIINVSIQEWGTYMAAFKAGKFDVVIGQWIGFSGPDMLKFVYHSTNTPPKGGNRVGYSNAEVDKLLDEATVETNGAKRTVLYKKAEQLLIDDYASINLWHPNIIWIGRSCLSDINLEPTGSFYPLITLENHCGK